MRRHKVIDTYFSIFLFQLTAMAPKSLIFMKDMRTQISPGISLQYFIK